MKKFLELWNEEGIRTRGDKIGMTLALYSR